MISFLHENKPLSADQGEAYIEALSRLESLREAISLAQPAGVDMASVSKSWPMASRAQRAAFQERADEMTRATAIGLDALARVKEAGADADPAQLSRLADALQGGVEDMDQLLTL